jgi:hypothetical protein
MAEKPLIEISKKLGLDGRRTQAAGDIAAVVGEGRDVVAASIYMTCLMRTRTTRKRQDEPIEDLEVRPTLDDIAEASGVHRDVLRCLCDDLMENAACKEVVAHNVLRLYFY